jgi:hypothetical protein
MNVREGMCEEEQTYFEWGYGKCTEMGHYVTSHLDGTSAGFPSSASPDEYGKVEQSIASVFFHDSVTEGRKYNARKQITFCTFMKKNIL